MAPLAKPFRLAVVVTASLAILVPFTARCETAPASVAETVAPWAPFVSEAAERFAIPAAWIRAVIRIESHGDIKPCRQRARLG